jgi:putative cell wall-binding protein
MEPKISKISKKQKNKDLVILEESVINSDDDDDIEAPKSEKPIIIKPKRILTEKQKEALQKGRDKAHERRSKKDYEEVKQAIIEQAKKETEDKLIKTAIKIKKKQLMQEKTLEKLDVKEEIPYEDIKKIIKQKNKPAYLIKEKIELPPENNPYSNYYFL